MEAWLPQYCYRDAPLEVEAIVIHYFSCINVAPENPYTMRLNWMLMHDLNVPKERRMQFLQGENDPEGRLYASAHCLIGRLGQLQLTVPENKQAYHAGKSEYKGRSDWNRFSYGIELIGTHDSGFTPQQYQRCADQCVRLMRANPEITLDWIVGHEEIAPGRKKDPGIATGNFNMDRLKELIAKELG